MNRIAKTLRANGLETSVDYNVENGVWIQQTIGSDIATLDELESI